MVGKWDAADLLSRCSEIWVWSSILHHVVHHSVDGEKLKKRCLKPSTLPEGKQGINGVNQNQKLEDTTDIQNWMSSHCGKVRMAVNHIMRVRLLPLPFTPLDIAAVYWSVEPKNPVQLRKWRFSIVVKFGWLPNVRDCQLA